MGLRVALFVSVLTITTAAWTSSPSPASPPVQDCEAFAQYNGPAVDPTYTLICYPLCPNTCAVPSIWLSYPSVYVETCKCPGAGNPVCCYGGVVYVDGDAFCPSTSGDCNPPNQSCRSGECHLYTGTHGIGARCGD